MMLFNPGRALRVLAPEFKKVKVNMKKKFWGVVMKNFNRYTGLPILLFALIYVGGCSKAKTTAPKGWLPSVSTAQHESYGGWITVRYHTGDSGGEVHGELITINPNQIFILPEQGFTNISIDCITRMKLTTIQLSRDGEVDKHRQMMYPVKPLDAFRAYARFPQGMPEGIDGQSLKLKKHTGITHSNASINGRPRAVNPVKSNPPQTQIRPTLSENGTVNATKRSLPDSKPIVNKAVSLRLEILGTSIPGIDINVIPGGELGLSFGKGPLMVDLNSRLFYSPYKDSKFVSFSAGIGGRYHFSNERNISPYLGGGVTWSYTRYELVKRELRSVCLRRSEQEEQGSFLGFPYTFTKCLEWGEEWQDIPYDLREGRGFGAYGIIGIEFRHLYRSRFNIQLRIDNPSYELEDPSGWSQRLSSAFDDPFFDELGLDDYAPISLGMPISLGISFLHQF